jgi:predicted 3-demethylubiquinone-9 3-methyltransferase (glyoxalase superfamily)
MALQKITPFLWYTREAEEAATVYTALFPDSRIVNVSKMGCDAPDAPPGAVTIVDFRLFGQKFTAMSAGPLDAFNHAISFVVSCADQAEVDRYWDGLLEGGGVAEQCGWLRDRFGVCWQIVPDRLMELMGDPDRAKAGRVSDAMLKMVKIDIAALEAAAAQS